LKERLAARRALPQVEQRANSIGASLEGSTGNRRRRQSEAARGLISLGEQAEKSVLYIAPRMGKIDRHKANWVSLKYNGFIQLLTGHWIEENSARATMNLTQFLLGPQI
jgi:hypothetical protein